MAFSAREAYEKGEGVWRLAPVFVPRLFSRAGHRLKLYPDDYYALGMARGAIKERWFSSVIKANNGPLAAEDEGLSYIAPTNDPGDRILLRDAISELGADAIGKGLFEKYGTWPMYSKFFDFAVPLFHHVHLTFDKAANVGRLGKPECYYFPPQLNNYLGTMPVTYFGFSPDVTPEEIKERLRSYSLTDNRITELSRAFRIQLGTGWYTPAGVIHAPGSVLTYEPQWNSDVNSVFENVASDEVYDPFFLHENCPVDKRDDIDYIFSLLDWEKNVDPEYRAHYFRPPILSAEQENYCEKWVVYGNDFVGAKELTVAPGCSVTIRDEAAYGAILTQGHGTFGVHVCETPTMIRFGQFTNDEFFVTEPAAKAGVVVRNLSTVEPLVMLKHFGPNHPDMPKV